MLRFPTPALAAVVTVLVMAIVAIPLWPVDIPPLLDYHNHLARQYILASLPESPNLQSFYSANWKASPYLAVDGIVQGLAHFLPVAVAGKVFLTVMLLLLALAPVALNWAAFGRVSPIALLGLLFVHNQTVSLGFVSYVFGIGFALCLLALWIRLRESAAGIRIMVFPLLATALFFCHLLGFVIYGLCAAAYEFGRHVAQVSGRRPLAPLRIGPGLAVGLLSLTLQLMLPLSLFLLFGPSSGSVASNTYGGLSRKFEALTGIVSYLMPPYLWRWDNSLSIVIPVVLAVLLLTRRLEISRPMLWPLGALLALFFAMPMELFSGWGADHRLLPAIGLMLIGSLRIRAGHQRLDRVVAVVVVALVAVRVVAVTDEWRKADAGYAEYVRAFEAVGEGSRMFFAFGQPHEKQIGRRPYKHMPTLVLMRRHVFVPYLFAGNSGVGPLRYKPEVADLRRVARRVDGPGGKEFRWTEIIAAYDYIMLVDERLLGEPAVSGLVPVFSGDRVSVYRTPGRHEVPASKSPSSPQ